MRLAWFTPWPPDTSGVAGRSVDVVGRLAGRQHGIDVFVDERRVCVDGPHPSAPPRESDVRVQSAHDFVWRATRGQYDLAVYQLGNSRQHEFIWPYVFRWPGLAVLHDARLHHARGRSFLHDGQKAAYRAEFRRSHPDVPVDAAELAVAGFDGAYYYLWPMTAPVVAASRSVAAHTRAGAQALADDFPGRPIAYLPIGGGRETPLTESDRREARGRFGFSGDEVVFGVFGALTAEKRIGQVIRAFRGLHALDGRARLLLAGRPDGHLDLDGLLEGTDAASGLRVVPDLDDADFERAIAATDVAIALRWPSATETSGPWVRALAAGRPTIVTDLPHLADIPALDPRTWQPSQPRDARPPVTVAIDVLDEDHSLGLAMRRLSADAALRERLGTAARDFWETEHAPDRVLDAYEAVLTSASATPAGRPSPAADAASRRVAAPVSALLDPFGPFSCELF